ncbi:MAG: hypothetical protein ACOC3V_01705 [bacterium]
MNNKAQIKLSFGMIFSIILIIIFLSVAFYAILKFLDLQKEIEIGKTIDSLKSDINRIWGATQASEKQVYNLPSEVKFVCFIDYTKNARGEFTEYEKGNDIINLYNELKVLRSDDNQNLFFYPPSSSRNFGAYKLDHINISKITQENNPYCIRNIKEKTSLLLKKDFGENLVIIEKA